jgi:Domain of unknown function (DUF5610)
MSTHAILSSGSPLKFLSQKFNQFNRVRQHGPDNEKPESARLKEHQPKAIRNQQKIAEKQILRGLEKVFGTEKSASTDNENAGIDADKLADRILAFAKRNFWQQKNNTADFDKGEFFTQIKQGIEEGFASASAALDKLGLLEGETKTDLDRAHQKILSGLSELESGQSTSVPSTTQVQGFSAKIRESAEVEVVTKEGDRVKIRLVQSASNKQSSADLSQGDISANVSQGIFENNSDFSVSIEGNLNEDEKQSLAKLLKNIDSISEDFFSGNFQAAFEHAQKIGLDAEQFSSFSLNLTLEKSVQAVAAYQQVANPEQLVDMDKIKQATDFFNQARKMMANAPAALAPFENPLSLFNTLFSAINNIENEPNSDKKSPDSLPTLEKIIKPIANMTLGDE